MSCDSVISEAVSFEKEFSGDIQVQSFLGEGTLFSISIPVPQREHRLLEYSKEK